MTAPRPTGTITFLFTDIEGSTRLRQAQPQAYQRSLVLHNSVLQRAIEGHGGFVFKIIGDAFCAAFHTAPDAVRSALDAQYGLQNVEWGEASLRVRMAIHTGAAELRDGDYWGFTLARVARLLPAGYGGQTLLSQAAADLVQDDLPPAASLRDLGEHRLRDLVRPEHIFQLDGSGLVDSFPSLNTLNAYPNNLPIALTSFIGRDAEIAALNQLLQDARLVTLVGVGGTGKTRLALQFAADVVDRFPHGAWLVELAALSDPGLLPASVAGALGLHDDRRQPLLATVELYLQTRRLLLVLDNCEHLLDGCARLAERLLLAAPGLRILATSREALGIAGEHTFPVPSLELPDTRGHPALDRLAQSEAVRLFLDRAVAVQPSFELTAANAPAVVQICQRLDGIPLAIELAAVRARVLPLDQIAARLDDRFRFLTGGSRTALERHQTLRAAIDWSYHMLSAPERALLQRLSVFAGGWTLEAAEAVADDAGTNDPPPWRAGQDTGASSRTLPGLGGTGMLDLLAQLVNKSLVVFENATGRYHLLDSILQYAREKLVDAEQAQPWRNRHLDYYVALAAQAEPELRSHGQVAWVSRLQAELDNIRAALAWAMASGQPEAVLRLAGDFWWLWLMLGRAREGYQWLEQVLAIQAPVLPSIRATMLWRAGVMMLRLADPLKRQFAAESLELCRALGDRAGVAYALVNSGMRMHYDLGDTPGARATVERAVELHRQIGNRWGLAHALNWLRFLAQAEGDLAAARAAGEEAIGIMSEVGDLGSMAVCVHGVAELARQAGDYGRAGALYEQVIRLIPQLNPFVRLWAQAGQAYVTLRQGNAARAKELFREAITLVLEHFVFSSGFAALLAGCAGAAAAEGQAARAVQLLAASEASLAAAHDRLDAQDQAEYDRDLAIARKALDEAAFAAAWAEGRAMTLEQAVAYALET